MNSDATPHNEKRKLPRIFTKGQKFKGSYLKVGRNTKALVAAVSERTLKHPTAMASVFAVVDSISSEVAAIIQSPVGDDLAVTEKEEKLEESMEMYQGLL